MNKRGESNNLMLTLFMALIIILLALAFINSVATSKTQQTDLSTITNKSVSVVTGYSNETYVNSSFNYTIYSQSDWKVSECPLTNIGISMPNGTLLVKDADYKVFAPQGVYYLINTTKTMPSKTGNLTYVNATYCQDGYLTSAGDRSIANMWTTIMIIVLIVVLLASVMKIWKNNSN
jgi:hypothetical protein